MRIPFNIADSSVGSLWHYKVRWAWISWITVKFGRLTFLNNKSCFFWMLPSSTRISVLPDSPLRSQLMRFFKLVEKMHGSREKRCEQGEHWNWQQYKILWKGTFLYVSNESCYRGVICRRSSNATLFFLLRCAGQIERRTSYYVQALISDFCVLLKQAFL